LIFLAFDDACKKHRKFTVIKYFYDSFHSVGDMVCKPLSVFELHF